jgi:hypothetical protein
MGIADGLSEFSVPAILIGAVVLIALASLALHLLFPPSKRKCPIKTVLPSEFPDAKTNRTTSKT